MARLCCINSRKRGKVDWFKATNRDSAIANQTSSAWFITNNNTLRGNVNRERERHRRTWLFIWTGPAASGSLLPTRDACSGSPNLHSRFLKQRNMPYIVSMCFYVTFTQFYNLCKNNLQSNLSSFLNGILKDFYLPWLPRLQPKLGIVFWCCHKLLAAS